MTQDIEAALRTLDPADRPMTADEQQRAMATLERIVATDPDRGGAAPATLPRKRSSAAPHRKRSSEALPRKRWFAPNRGPGHGRRAGIALTAVATFVAGAVAVELVQRESPSYASWTAVPAVAADDDVARVAAACRPQLEGSSLDLSRARLVLAERRGEHVALLYRTDDPDLSGACLARQPPGTDEVLEVNSGVGGSSGPALRPPPRGYTQGAVSQFEGASITDGAVGAQVVGVTIHAGDMTVEASVADGRYTAWWPGAAFSDAADEPDGKPRFVLTYDLTLADGTVVRNAEPTLPG
ncbi:hypothetical protein [Egicoccus sp. AB-alg2]|uniref:hypothetical protein n=1 Tax=Egicoccus sp. AB-alg2 TaxID=3242693 RepID=UPI00359DF523